MNTSRKTALVIGATGIVGRAIVEELGGMEDWSVIAVSKSGAPVPGAQASISADLLNRQSALERLGDAKGATHVFYAAYAPRASVVEEAEPNLALFINSIEGVEAAGAKLEHVVLITGAKYYGVHLGPSAAPARETNPRHIGPNFYYAQEDYLRSRSPAAWSWTHLVPTHLTGFSTGNPMNLVLPIAVYASIAKQLGLRLDFPGTEAAFKALTHIVDAQQLAAAAAWAATSDAARNEVFNIANGDPTRWSELWPVFAGYFGLKPGGPRPIPLSGFMAAQEPVWGAITAKYGLKPLPFAKLVNWGFGEFMFKIDYDIILALGKIRRAGFTAHPDTAERFLKRFDQYALAGIIPALEN
jgi:nucleoside-diphosphate-sugar epimerase